MNDFLFFCFSKNSSLFVQVLKRESAVSSLEQSRDKTISTVWVRATPSRTHSAAHTQPQEIFNLAFNTSSPKHQELSLKKTWGWNLTLLLALRRLEQPSCHCDCHYCCVSNGGPANVSPPLGTSESPPALSDWGAIYLSASTSTPLLPNPSFRQGPQAPMENTYSHTAPKSISTMAVEGTWIA